MALNGDHAYPKPFTCTDCGIVLPTPVRYVRRLQPGQAYNSPDRDKLCQPCWNTDNKRND